MNTIKKTYIAGALVAALAGGALFQAVTGGSSNEINERKVAATIFPLYDITREIAGDEFDVVLMLPAGASPHTFDPQPSLLKDLEGTQTVFSIGNGLDTWADSLTEAVGAEEVTVDTDIMLRETAEDHDEHGEEEHHDDEDEHHEDEDGEHEDDGHEDEEHDDTGEESHDDDDEEDEHGHGPVDPHYWLSIHNAEQIALNIATELGELDAQNADVYTDRATAYSAQLESLENELTAKTASLTDQNIISLHDAWEYFAAEFGLDIVGTFEPSGGEGPTPQYLATLQEEVEQNAVSVLFIEPQLSTASVSAFAADNNLSIAQIDPLGGADGRDSYIELMRYNVEQVVSALTN